MTLDLERLKRAAKQLRRRDGLKHADALHRIAQNEGFTSWPRLKAAAVAQHLDRGARADALKFSLFLGRHTQTDALLKADPSLPDHDFGLACALADADRVAAALAKDPGSATRIVGVRSPLLHLAFSKDYTRPGASGSPLDVARLLQIHGADVNDSYPAEPGSEHRLSALYGALGHAGHLALAEWLLEQGASPDDNESLYHATELEHLDGLKLLMRFNVTTAGTNALPRMLDFNNLAGVKLLLDYGADPNEGVALHPSGQPNTVIPALHQAARRMCSGAIAEALIEAGADGTVPYQGHTAYAIARMRGNHAVAEVLMEHGQETQLDPAETLLARAADGPVSGRIAPEALTLESRRILTRLFGFEGKLDHAKRLVELGIDPDWTDEQDMPAIHIAGWEGLPDAVEWLLTFDPDLHAKNMYGGDLVDTILHGADNCPKRRDRDHIACLKMALSAGGTFRRKELEFPYENAEFTAILEDWMEIHPAALRAD